MGSCCYSQDYKAQLAEAAVTFFGIPEVKNRRGFKKIFLFEVAVHNIPALLDWSFFAFSLIIIFMWPWAVSGSVLPSCSISCSSSSLNSFFIYKSTLLLQLGSSWALCPPVPSAPSQSPSQILSEEMAPQKRPFSISAGIPITSQWAESQAGRIFIPSSVI